MTDLIARQSAGAEVLRDIQNAREAGEAPDSVLAGLHLAAIAHSMKPAHRLGALKIVKEYCSFFGMDGDTFIRQAWARMLQKNEEQDL